MQQNYIHKNRVHFLVFLIYFTQIIHFANIHNIKGCSITNLYPVSTAGLRGAA